MLPTKKDMKRIKQKFDELKKDPKNRALLVIQTLCGGDVVCADLENTIYTISTAALFPDNPVYKDWNEKTEKLFKSFEKDGLI